jgi:hypothetical protein
MFSRTRALKYNISYQITVAPIGAVRVSHDKQIAHKKACGGSAPVGRCALAIGFQLKHKASWQSYLG